MNTNDFITRYGSKLNEQQLQAIESVEGPVLLLAVPGSGKTTVLVTRIGYMILCCDINPDNILVLTYTIAATKDMGNRFSSIFGEKLAWEIEFRTINGICAKIIQTYGRKIGKEPFELLTDDKAVNKIVTDILTTILPEYPTESDVRIIKTWITYCKNMLLGEKEIRDIGEKENIPLYETYTSYNQYLRSNRLMDYDDQMVYAYRMLRNDSELLDSYRKQFPFICVDEAQDTSKIQHLIIGLLAGTNGNLFMVGDEDQSIYGFRAAYPEALLDFEVNHPNAKVLVMSRNYRSTANIVKSADLFIQANIYRHKKIMIATRQDSNDIRYINLNKRSQQYNYLFKVAQDCRHETAVLYRLNESCIPLVDLLDRYDVPYRIKGLDMTFFTHRIVQDIINIMRFAQNPYDTELFLKIYFKVTYLKKSQAENMCFLSKDRNLPVLDTANYIPSINEGIIKKCHSLKTHLEKMLKESPDKAIIRITRYMGYANYMERLGMDYNKIFILTQLAYRESTLSGFEKRIGYLYNMLKNTEPNYGANFILSTIHSSKGLEYDEVFLMDVLDGVFPVETESITNPKCESDKKEGEEERRLFYVGMTRAKNRLNMFTFSKEQSIFVEDLKDPESAIERARNRANDEAKWSYLQGMNKKTSTTYSSFKDKEKQPSKTTQEKSTNFGFTNPNYKESSSNKESVNKKREEYILDGKTYYFMHGKWVDSHFVCVSKEETYKLNSMRTKRIDFENISKSELIKMAQDMKDGEDYIYSKKLFEKILEKETDTVVIRNIISRYTSILRKVGQPREAIQVAEKYIGRYGKYVYSPTLFTSLAAAYCDIGDAAEARKKANIAMSMNAGKAGIELQSVYKRIKSLEE